METYRDRRVEREGSCLRDSVNRSRRREGRKRGRVPWPCDATRAVFSRASRRLSRGTPPAPGRPLVSTGRRYGRATNRRRRFRHSPPTWQWRALCQTGQTSNSQSSPSSLPALSLRLAIPATRLLASLSVISPGYFASANLSREFIEITRWRTRSRT